MPKQLLRITSQISSICKVTQHKDNPHKIELETGIQEYGLKYKLNQYVMTDFYQFGQALITDHTPWYRYTAHFKF